MKSRFEHLKKDAIKLRKQGSSIREIESKLGIPRSTLSYWLKSILLSERQKNSIYNRKLQKLALARVKAVKWHNDQKEKRIHLARKQAEDVLSKIDTKNISVNELCLSILYLAEGAKKNPETAMGSSDPLTIKYFLKSIENIYGIEREKFRYELYLRHDQNEVKIVKFWSKELDVPVKNFTQIRKDIRTKGTNSYNNYNGVCSVRCGNIWIQRRLVFIAREYFAIIADQ